MLIEESMLDELTEKAKTNPRLRMNHNLHDSPDSKAQRVINALEPGAVLPIHRHVDTTETFILLRGRITVRFYDMNKNVLETIELNLLTGKYGVNIPMNTWHTVRVEETGTIIFEVKDGPYTPLGQENILQ